jgi:hypothetical protein
MLEDEGMRPLSVSNSSCGREQNDAECILFDAHAFVAENEAAVFREKS